MMAGIGLFLLIFGGGSVIATAFFNSQSPLQLGPIPFFVSLAVAVVGFAMISHFPWTLRAMLFGLLAGVMVLIVAWIVFLRVIGA